MYGPGKDTYGLRRFEKMLEELDVRSTEGDDQIFGGDPCPFIYLSFSYNCPQRRSILASQRQTVEEADSFTPLMNRQPTVAV
jgi:hypothetical protein